MVVPSRNVLLGQVRSGGPLFPFCPVSVLGGKVEGARLRWCLPVWIGEEVVFLRCPLTKVPLGLRSDRSYPPSTTESHFLAPEPRISRRPGVSSLPSFSRGSVGQKKVVSEVPRYRPVLTGRADKGLLWHPNSRTKDVGLNRLKNQGICLGSLRRSGSPPGTLDTLSGLWTSLQGVGRTIPPPVYCQCP